MSFSQVIFLRLLFSAFIPCMSSTLDTPTRDSKQPSCFQVEHRLKLRVLQADAIRGENGLLLLLCNIAHSLSVLLLSDRDGGTLSQRALIQVLCFSHERVKWMRKLGCLGDARPDTSVHNHLAIGGVFVSFPFFSLFSYFFHSVPVIFFKVHFVQLWNLNSKILSKPICACCV